MASRSHTTIWLNVWRRTTSRRYAFDVSGELIRANQGHSVEVDLQLEEREPPEFLYHGTVERFLPSILEEGLVGASGTTCIFQGTWRPRPGSGRGGASR